MKMFFQASDSNSNSTMKRIERVDDSPPSPLSETEDFAMATAPGGSDLASMAVQQGSALLHNTHNSMLSDPPPVVPPPPPRLPPKRKISQQLVLSNQARRMLPDKPKLFMAGHLPGSNSPAATNSSLHQRLPSNEGLTTGTENSDVDSVSTTSASYVVNHSDVDSVTGGGLAAGSIGAEEGKDNQGNSEERAHSSASVAGRTGGGGDAKEGTNLDAPSSSTYASAPASSSARTSAVRGEVEEEEGSSGAGISASGVVAGKKEKKSSQVTEGVPEATSAKDLPTGSGSTSGDPFIKEGEEEEEPKKGGKKKKSVSALIARFEKAPSSSSSSSSSAADSSNPRSARSLTPDALSAAAAPSSSSSAGRNARAKSQGAIAAAVVTAAPAVVEIQEEEESSSSLSSSAKKKEQPVKVAAGAESEKKEEEHRQKDVGEEALPPIQAAGEEKSENSPNREEKGSGGEREKKPDEKGGDSAKSGDSTAEQGGATKEKSNEALELGEGEEDLPLGAEAVNPDLVDDLDEEEMAKTLRHGGQRQGYTSYVFISSGKDEDGAATAAAANDTASVVSAASSRGSNRSNRSRDSNKVVVNVKEPGASCVVLQDGRASNISIVSTESSELGSPNSPTGNNVAPGAGDDQDQDRFFQPQAPMAPPPDLPSKARTRNGGVVDLAYHFGGPLDPYRRDAGGSRSRGGEQYPEEEEGNVDAMEDEELDDELLPGEERISSSPGQGEAGGGGDSGLANYFNQSLESPSSTPSRRGRPPVIRAADRVARTRHGGAPPHAAGYPEEGDYLEDRGGGSGAGGEMVEGYLDDEYGEYVEEEGMVEEYDEHGRRILRDRHGRVTYVEEEGDDLMYGEEGDVVHYEDDGRHHHHYHHGYDVRYEGDSGDSYHDEADEAENGAARDYPMCQPVYVDDSGEEYVSGDGSGDEYLDREEELRGYNRQIDFTLHTIIEESCEDSDPDAHSRTSAEGVPRGDRSAGARKRMSDPSELEKYFFYDVGGGQRDDEVVSDSFSENSMNTSGGNMQSSNNPEEDSYLAEEEASSRYEQYFRSGIGGENLRGVEEEESAQNKSLDMISDRGNTDDSGSVGSESDGQRSPVGQGSKKKRHVKSKSGYQRASGESDNCGTADEGAGAAGEHSYSGSSDDNSAFLSSSDGQDTVKRKKRRSKQQQVVAAVAESDLKKGDSPKGTPPITPLPNQVIEVQPVAAANEKSVSPTGSESRKSKISPSTTPPPSSGQHHLQVMRKHKSRDSGFVGSTDDLLRNESAPASIASSGGGGAQAEQQSLSASSDGENSNHSGASGGSGGGLTMPAAASSLAVPKQSRLEKVSEVSENTEDDSERTPTKNSNHSDDGASANNGARAKVLSAKKTNLESRLSGEDEEQRRSTSGGGAKVARKDSFHNWSSDEDTNIMMNRMRTFFKGIIQGYGGSSSAEAVPAAAAPKKSDQIVAFEEQLARLMRTVPGINEDQVREIVEYLSSEDTWSDSYDSSDYTSTSDMESRYPDIPDLANLAHMDGEAAAHLRQQISASCQEIIQKFDTNTTEEAMSVPSVPAVDSEDFEKETELMYQKLMARMQQNQLEEERERRERRQQQEQQQQQQRSRSKSQSPVIGARMMHHISSRLVALMHEVTAASGASDNNSSSPSSLSDQRQRQQQQKSQRGSGRLRRVEDEDYRVSNSSEDKASSSRRSGSGGGYTFESLDSPAAKGTSHRQSTSASLSKSSSKSVELLDSGAGGSGRRKSLEDSSRSGSGSNSSSLRKGSSRSEYDVWKGAHRGAEPPHGASSGGPPPPSHRRGSSVHSSSSGVSDLVNDDERWSWKGSFDSALAAEGGAGAGGRAGSSASRHLRRSIGESVNEQGGSRSSLTSRSRREREQQHQSDEEAEAEERLSSRLDRRRGSMPETAFDQEEEEDQYRRHQEQRESGRSYGGSGLSARHNTNSLPRLGTSAIKKNRAPAQPITTASLTAASAAPRTTTATTTASLATSLSAGPPGHHHPPGSSGVVTAPGVSGPRSARYRPPGYKPGPGRKMSPSSLRESPSRSGGPIVGRYTGEFLCPFSISPDGGGVFPLSPFPPPSLFFPAQPQTAAPWKTISFPPLLCPCSQLALSFCLVLIVRTEGREGECFLLPNTPPPPYPSIPVVACFSFIFYPPSTLPRGRNGGEGSGGGG